MVVGRFDEAGQRLKLVPCPWTGFLALHEYKTLVAESLRAKPPMAAVTFYQWRSDEARTRHFALLPVRRR
jgi:hypothetical protein